MRVIDTDTLHTLPDRELRAGLAEVIKYGLIRDTDFLAYLDRTWMRCSPWIRRSLPSHPAHLRDQGIVAEDEREGGVRAILNLGHTFGHAIETATATRWLHGEASPAAW